MEVSNVETPQDTSLNDNDINAPDSSLLDLPVNNDLLFKLQQKDTFCNNILTQIEKRKYNLRTNIYSKRQTPKEICHRWEQYT